MSHSVTLDRIEDDRAILITDSHQLVTCPTEWLPTDLIIGDKLIITLDLASKKSNSNEQAKAMLNELLNVDQN
ncbi:MAG: hypothetical protein WCK11_02770 [Candidatus Falkowbacteria bacterium]